MTVTEQRTGKLSDREWWDRHRYSVWPQGSTYPGTTTIASLLDNGKAAGFAGAAACLTREGKDYKAEWEASGTFGNRVHTHALSWQQGHEIDELLDEKPYMDALAAWIDQYEPFWLEMERVVLGRMPNLEYGGRFDCICRIRADVARGLEDRQVIRLGAHPATRRLPVCHRDGHLPPKRHSLVRSRAATEDRQNGLPLPAWRRLVRVHRVPGGSQGLQRLPRPPPGARDRKGVRSGREKEKEGGVW